MTELNQTMKKHTCPTCGGQLVINEARQMYECPFCGVSFDYEYFREDDVLARASRSLRAGEFLSAKDAYDFMLKKEPHNFQALRGRIMVSAKIKTTLVLRQPATYREMKYIPVEQSIDEAIAAASPEHTGYFSKMKELVDTGKAYKEEIRLANVTRGDRRKQYEKIRSYEDRMDEEYFTTKDPWDGEETVQTHPQTVLVSVVLIYLFWCVLMAIMFGTLNSNPYSTSNTKSSSYTITSFTYTPNISVIVGATSGMSSKEVSRMVENYVYYDAMNSARKNSSVSKSESIRLSNSRKWEKEHESDTSILWSLILIPGIGVLGFAIYTVGRLKTIKRYEEQIMKEEKTVDSISAKINDHEKEANRLKAQINKLYSELVALDPMPETPTAASK